MTNPTPTRAEVEAECRWLLSRLGNRTTEAHLEECTVPMLLALRERAEAAERHKDAGWDQQRYWCDRYVNKTAALERALVEARRAEAAAWNDAIEAAALEAEWRIMPAFAASIRALRRAAPTEDLT